MQNLAKVVFDVRKPVSRIDIGAVEPTLLILLLNAKKQLLLVQPLKEGEPTRALQFPQCPIGHMKSPLDTVAGLLLSECGLTSSDLTEQHITAIYRKQKRTQKGVVKDYYCVLANIRPDHNPSFTEMVRKKTASIKFVNGPCHLWSEMRNCYASKQRMLAEIVKSAFEKGLLSNELWTRDSLIPVLQFAGR